MPRPPRTNSDSRIHHVYNRGNGLRILFEDAADRTRFLALLEARTTENNVEIHAWCLMSNHFHMLLRGEIDAIARCMKLLQSGYALYFNKRHGHVGGLFAARYQSRHVDDDAHYKAVIRYIHENPRNAGLTRGLSYRWSSYDEYRHGTGLVTQNHALSLFGSIDAFERFHCEPHADNEFLGGSSVATRGSTAMEDEDALAVASKILGLPDPSRAVPALPQRERDKAIRSLRRNGFSIRRIQRLTGIPYRAIARLAP